MNLYAEALPQDSKTPVVLYGTPGTARFSLLPTWPVLGLHRMGETLYAVTTSKLYSVEWNGKHKELADVELSGRVSMANNGRDLVLVDGINGYAWDSQEESITQLGGDGWYPANTVTYQDGYFIFNRAGTGQFFLSELLNVTFDPLAYATAEGAPDDTLAVLSDHRELWVFGEHSIEVWYNSGDPDFPFERMQGAFIERGIAAPHSAAKMDNSVFWLGDDGVIYRASGYQPQRISTHAVEYSILDADNADAFAYTYTEEGHVFYVLTFPSIQKTWCFDVATGLWHERAHSEWGRHHGNCYANAYGHHLIGDWQNGLIYMLDMNALDDAGDEIRRHAVSPPLSARRQRMNIFSLELDMGSGIGLAHGQGENPQAMLRWSDDGGNTWSHEYWSSIGRMGKYLTRVIWRRLGSCRQRQFEIVITDPVPVVILGAFLEVDYGRH
ncbi:MAG: packaged DNA stabilization protein [Pseudomonadota bacterium]